MICTIFGRNYWRLRHRSARLDSLALSVDFHIDLVQIDHSVVVLGRLVLQNVYAVLQGLPRLFESVLSLELGQG